MTAIIILPRFLFLPMPAGPDAPARFELVRFGIHVFEYSILALLLFRALAARSPSRFPTLWLALGLTLSFGIADEVQQGFTPNRQPSMLDVVSDAAGAAVAATALALLHRKRPPL